MVDLDEATTRHKMISAPLHSHENERLEYLSDFKIERGAVSDLDDLLDMACKMMDIPKGLIFVVESDEVFFKSQYGLNLASSPRDLSFCSHAIASGESLFYIEDATNHPQFFDHPYVTAPDPVVFYAGVPIMDENELPLGTVCVIDSQPRSLNEHHKKSLKFIAKMIMKHLAAQKKVTELQKQSMVLEEKNLMLRNFAHVVSHDIKMPLANVVMTSDLMREKYLKVLDEKGIQYLKGMKSSALSMSDYIDNILKHYESEQSVKGTRDRFTINELLLNIQQMLGMENDHVHFILPEDDLKMQCDRAAVEQILLNLIGNSLKYNYQERVRIQINAMENKEYYRLSVIDNGIGIPKGQQEKIFELFTTLNQTDRNGKNGTGIGLSTVKILVDKLGGVITCKSRVNQGTQFTFTVAK